MPDVSTNEALERIVVALENMAESLGAIEDLAVTIDTALTEFHPTDHANFSGFMRSYKRAAEELNKEVPDDDENES